MTHQEIKAGNIAIMNFMGWSSRMEYNHNEMAVESLYYRPENPRMMTWLIRHDENWQEQIRVWSKAMNAMRAILNKGSQEIKDWDKVNVLYAMSNNDYHMAVDKNDCLTAFQGLLFVIEFLNSRNA